MTTTIASDARLARVRKLLAKAEDPGVTPEEAQTYTAKAAELVAAYGIDRALLAERDPTADVPGDRVIELLAPYARDKAGLLWAVAEAVRCRGVLRTEHTHEGKVLRMHVFGFASDLERLELLHTSLLVQLAHGVAATPVPRGESAAAYRRTWIAGFTAAVRSRLARAEELARHDAERVRAERPAGARPVSLVLADRTDRVDRLLREAYPGVGTAPRRTLTGSGYGGGWAAGSRADLGAGRLGRRPPRGLAP